MQRRFQEHWKFFLEWIIIVDDNITSYYFNKKVSFLTSQGSDCSTNVICTSWRSCYFIQERRFALETRNSYKNHHTVTNDEMSEMFNLLNLQLNNA